VEDGELARRIYWSSHLTGNFVLRSGKTSNEYFDKYLFESDPEILREVAERLMKLVPPDVEVLAGLELGGVPIATAVSLHSKIPVVFVRKRPKEYGTKKIVEGIDITGRRVCVIEDVVTTGGQVIESAGELRKLGAQVDSVLCVIVREKKASQNLAGVGLTLKALFAMDDLVKHA
jgi:orotate phosphoribosyltransferase